MSLTKLVRGVVRGVAAVYTGGASEALYQAYEASKRARTVGATVPMVPSRGMNGGAYQPVAMPGAGYTPAMAIIPRLGTALAPAIGAGAARLAAGARTIARSAMTYCRRHPQWCATIGGIAAIEGLIRSGQLPPVKRRRARGITGTELRNFRRVTKILNKWCKVGPPMRRSRRKC